MKTDNKTTIQAILLLGTFVIIILILSTLQAGDVDTKKGIVGDLISLAAIVFGAKTISEDSEKVPVENRVGGEPNE